MPSLTAGSASFPLGSGNFGVTGSFVNKCITYTLNYILPPFAAMVFSQFNDYPTLRTVSLNILPKLNLTSLPFVMRVSNNHAR